GKLVPTITLPANLVAGVEPRGAVDWSLVGGEVCAEALVRRDPDRVRQAIWRMADRRLASKVAAIEGRLTGIAPAEVLYQEIWDGLGFSANRGPMRDLARRLPLSAIEPIIALVEPEERIAAVRGLLFGVGGFLPISPADASFAGWTPDEVSAAESAWERFGGPWRSRSLAPTDWTRARVRPANHPALRLSAGASLLASVQGGLLPTLLTGVRDGADLPLLLRDLCDLDGQRLLGADRATGIVANAVIPFALAHSEQTGDLALGEAAAQQWERLPSAESNEVTRRALRQVAGDARLTGLGERGQQGLIQLDQTLCRPRRCFECPVAALVLENAVVGSEHQ
ncbi:MAG: DUF2851 family protein, partial [Thermomicrobiales bacterium]|nr:DUF2851 family protein [Thermomicrobiales bacterium]